MERITIELNGYYSLYLLSFALFTLEIFHLLRGILCTRELDKFKSHNYFLLGNLKKGGMKHGMGITNLETF